MKLGDSMAPIEACNVWNDVCPRKTRPPKIGDIPRHVAVDEESPGSSNARAAARINEASRNPEGSTLERPSARRRSERADNPASLPRLETFLKSSESSTTTIDRVSRTDGETKFPINDSAELSSRSIALDGTLNGPPSICDDSRETSRTERPFEDPENKPCTQGVDSTAETDRKLYEETVADGVSFEVRKDSALYIDERSLETLGSLVSTGPPVVQRNVEEGAKSRLARPRTRRESSGYFSNLGTFDEDRWTACPMDQTNLQDATMTATTARESLLRERRRSSTKTNRLPTTNSQQPQLGIHVGSQQVNSSLLCPATDETNLSSSESHAPQTANAITKSGRIEMPDIDEQPGLETNKRCIDARRENAEDDSTIEAQFSDKLSIRSSTFRNDDDSTIGTQFSDKLSIRSSTFRNDDDSTIAVELSDKLSIRSSTFRNEVSPRLTDSSTIEAENNRPRGSNNGETDEPVRKTLNDSAAQRSSPRAGPVNRQRRRMVVHQYSSPNITNSELERIVEKPHGEKISYATGESKPDANSGDAEKLGEIENDEDDDDQVVVARHDRDESDDCRENVGSEAREILPRSVKVYQLLSTQSEDRGDGDARLFDRRISLQIPRNNEEEVTSRVNECQLSTTDFSGSGSEHADEKKLVHADSVPILKIPSSVSSTVEGELRLCVNERLPGSEIPTGSAIAGIRPIYPYCPYSPYASPQGSPRTNRRRPLRESRRVSIDSRQGALQLNQYKLLNNIGQGSYGIVKLAFNEEDETHYAMKILSKKKLMKKAGIFGRIAPGRKGVTNPLAKVYREIALLKKLDHPNVVKLVEVLDDPDEDNLYLVFELVQKGEVMQLPTDKPLDEETARRHFRDVVMGVEYLHYQRIVHRDIKPSNLLVDSDGRVKVADLGVSAELRAAGELLSGTAGTPAFAAPETTIPGAQYSGTLCDVWSMGVTLYSLVTGKVPWDGAGSIIGVQAAVRSEPLRFPEKPRLSDSLRDLISRMLAKDPARRMSLAEIKEHRWLTNNGEEPLPNEADNCRLPVTVTDEEVARVVTRVPKLDTLILIKTMLKQHSFQNPFLPRRIVRTGCTSGEAVASGVCLKQQPSTDTTDSPTDATLPTSETLKSKTQQFHKAGRSNSAPDSYEWQTNGRQISNDPMLAPVTESSSQEAEVENR